MRHLETWIVSRFTFSAFVRFWLFFIFLFDRRRLFFDCLSSLVLIFYSFQFSLTSFCSDYTCIHVYLHLMIGFHEARVLAYTFHSLFPQEYNEYFNPVSLSIHNENNNPNYFKATIVRKQLFGLNDIVTTAERKWKIQWENQDWFGGQKCEYLQTFRFPYVVKVTHEQTKRLLEWTSD